MGNHLKLKRIVVLGMILVLLIACSPQISEQPAKFTQLPTISSTSIPLTTSTNFPTEISTHRPVITSTDAPTATENETPIATERTYPSTKTPFPTVSVIPISTFVPENATTYTPAPASSCPSDNLNPEGMTELVDFIFSDEWNWEDPGYEFEGELLSKYLEVLNSGGAIALQDSILAKRPDQHHVFTIDLTNDGVAEQIFVSPNYYPMAAKNLYVFGCVNGEYRMLFKESPEFDTVPWIEALQDLNMDGVVDLVIGHNTCNVCYGVRVYEWDGEKFDSIARRWIDFGISSDEGIIVWDMFEMSGYANGYIQDMDGNGTYEIIVEGGKPGNLPGAYGYDGPVREEKHIYMWDGNYFVRYSNEYTSSPEFRFQALQDGDLASQARDYNDALAFYQEVIFSDQLASWSPEIFQIYIGLLNQESGSEPIAWFSALPFDQKEYNQLSAYARFRIMLLHILRGYDGDAETVYSTIQQKYPPGHTGYPYAEMATVFWSEYQHTSSISNGCEAVVDYAEQHPEILEPLGSGLHGFWSEQYQPIDVCPFTNDAE